jgi:hypothetical protein
METENERRVRAAGTLCLTALAASAGMGFRPQTPAPTPPPKLGEARRPRGCAAGDRDVIVTVR